MLLLFDSIIVTKRLQLTYLYALLIIYPLRFAQT